MNKDKTEKAAAKTAKKAARKDLEKSIASQITELANGLGFGSKKAENKINKTAKVLARSLAELKAGKKIADKPAKLKKEVLEKKENGAPEFSSPVPLTENNEPEKKPVISTNQAHQGTEPIESATQLAQHIAGQDGHDRL